MVILAVDSVCTLVERQVKYPVGAEDYEDRTKYLMLKDMEQALQQNASENGVKGPSPLINMPDVDIVWGFVPDYMHSVLLGVTRQLTKLQVDTSSSTEPYYVGSPRALRVLDERLRAFQTPDMMTRMPQGLSERAHGKQIPETYEPSCISHIPSFTRRNLSRRY